MPLAKSDAYWTAFESESNRFCLCAVIRERTRTRTANRLMRNDLMGIEQRCAACKRVRLALANTARYGNEAARAFTRFRVLLFQSRSALGQSCRDLGSTVYLRERAFGRVFNQHFINDLATFVNTQPATKNGHSWHSARALKFESSPRMTIATIMRRVDLHGTMREHLLRSRRLYSTRQTMVNWKQVALETQRRRSACSFAEACSL